MYLLDFLSHCEITSIPRYQRLAVGVGWVLFFLVTDTKTNVYL